ncbi:hypothetical protein ENUP19_0298G0077 [Entamoeba nuttalli]|uniref:Uncharacterized protein n=2 Tax=Entamoeba nuttalli TaxID=412467 RepID=K2HFM4_ENTNP|nr:hypothetical protein ENU1_049710 [Entamoeba nuttalli P19]EKE41619.1 hypothetical protein ENU1_049710 [Entamoeba nuttalli P19]|eukprot:XP_008856044.1 hypothetical protein ENU1_049710 [Entamoeba nuttalli P19]
MQIEFAAYDCELQHLIFGSNPILQGGCTMYETMKGVIGEEVCSLRLRNAQGLKTDCIFTSLDGGLMLGACGPLEIIPDVLSILKQSITMRYGCYKSLKPIIECECEDPGKAAKIRAASLLNNPTFLPIIHSISSHISSCTPILSPTHPLFNPRIPYRSPTIASFTNSMRYISKRVLDNALLGAALYVNKENYITIASTLPSDIDPIVRLVSLALSSETMARKTTVSQIYLTISQLNALTASSVVVGKQNYDKIKTTLHDSPIICDECQLKKVNIVVTVNKGFVMVELACWNITPEYLERSETENLAGMEGLSSIFQMEGRKTDLMRLRIDYDTLMVEPSKLWASNVNEQLLKCINMEKINYLEGIDNTIVVPENENECYYCSQSLNELNAIKVSFNEIDKKTY